MQAYNVQLTDVPLLTSVLIRSRDQAVRLAAALNDAPITLVAVTEEQATVLLGSEHAAWVESYIEQCAQQV